MKSIISENVKIAEIEDSIKSGNYKAYKQQTADGHPVNSFDVKVSSAKKWNKIYTEDFGKVDGNGFIKIY